MGVILLTRDQFLGGVALGHEDVEVPELGGAVRVREMTVGEQEAYTRLIAPDGATLDLDNFQAKLVTCTLCDESGALLLTPGDVEAVSRLSAVVVGRIWEAARRVNHIDAAAVEELGKGLAARRGGSSSVSPSSSDAPSPNSSEV